MRTRASAAILAIIVLGLTPGVVAAHAKLVSANPAADATLTASPPEIVLTFDEPLGGASSFDVVDPTGTMVAKGSLDASDAHVLRAVPPMLGDGVFEIRWTAASSDGDIERGTYQFTVGTGTDVDGSGADSPGGVAAPIVAAMVLVGGGLIWFLRRRQSVR